MAIRESRRKYYWLLASDPETKKPYLIFGGDTEEEARQKGLDLLNGVDFEIRGLHTHSLPAASAEVRGKRLEETHSLKKASERLGHSRSIARLRRRLAGEQ